MGAIHRFQLVFALLGTTVVTGAVYSSGVGIETVGASSAPYRFSFGIVPQRTATQLAESWTPLLNHLGAETGYRFDFKTARDIHTFTQRLAAGAYDLVYMSPYHYVVAQKQQQYRVFAREKDRELTGIIVVRTDSPYRSLRDLRGKTLAFPASAFAASLVPRVELKREGIQFNPSFVNSHDSVYLGVAQGLFDGGGGIRHIFARLAPKIRARLRVLWASRGYTAHAIAAHPRVPQEVIRRISAVMRSLDQNPKTRRLLEGLGFQGIVSAADSEYDTARELEVHLRKLRNDE